MRAAAAIAVTARAPRIGADAAIRAAEPDRAGWRRSSLRQRNDPAKLL